MPDAPTTPTLDGTPITRRDAETIFDRPTSALHRFVLRFFRLLVLEMEDVHFHFDSAVMMPDHGDCATNDPADANHISGLAVLRAIYTHAQRHEENLLLIAGHTDRSGPDAYNLNLSDLRAENVLHLLLGNRDGWVGVSEQKHKTEDIQQILSWIAVTFGFPCDPGPKTNQMNPQTRAAIRNFQERYNVDFDPDIGVDGVVGRETWGAFFDMYERGLIDMLQTTPGGLAELRAGVKFLDDAKRTVGCGERHPITSDPIRDRKSRIDRRVEIMFFDPAERPNLNCHPSRGVCNHQVCELYGPNRIFGKDPLGCEDWAALVVHLQLQWKDPEGNARNFPAGVPVIVTFGDGSTLNATTTAKGRLTFTADRRKRSFTLGIDTSGNAKYVASAPGAAGDETETLVFEPEVGRKVMEGQRVFLLPKRRWDLKHADWSVPPGVTNFSNSQFTGLEDVAVTVGRRSAPVLLTLDPHWMFFKLLYFDRFIKRKLSILPVMVDGFADLNDPPAALLTRSNWLTSPQGSQALPWIIRRDDAGAAQNKPDGRSLLKVRTLPGTFIESRLNPESRQFVSLQSKNPGGTETPRINDPGLNGGASFERDMNKAEADRLRFYDLPDLWKSTGWWTKQEKAAAGSFDEDIFANMASRATTNDRPLLFSLDDLVLTDENLDPIALTANDRVAIFSHRFAKDGDPNLEPTGLYKPNDRGNAANNDPGTRFFSQKVQRLKNNVNYIADYPDWTRLVICKGNAFDVFDQRLAEGPGKVVGARAGVRWVDSAGISAPGSNPSRPNATRKPFFVIQPFFEQKHDRFNIGRVDLIGLRCCDVSGAANDVEQGVVLNYLRYFHRFNTPAGELKDNQKNALPSTSSGAAATAFVNRCCFNIARRWNGPEGTFTPGPARLVPVGANPRFESKVMVFIQDLERSISHFEVRVFQKIRASMGGQSGTGQISDGTLPAGHPDAPSQDNSLSTSFFTAAHETGHAMSLEDDYIEETIDPGKPSVFVRIPGFESFYPGSPYYDDEKGMMRTNAQIRARFFWHLAEWMRTQADPDRRVHEVRHATHRYRIKSHPNGGSVPMSTHFTLPLERKKDRTSGERGKYDVMIYPMGQDAYTADVLPTSGRAPGRSLAANAFFDGMLLVEVRMRFEFHDTADIDVISQELNTIQLQIKQRFNNRFQVSGSAHGVNFQHCILHFSPRFLVEDHSQDNPGPGRHFHVDVHSDGNTVWDDGIFGPGRTLRYRMGQVPNFLGAFANMIGIAANAVNNANSYRAIVDEVFPGGNIAAI